MGTAVEVVVTGRVQGVAFRWYAEQEARRRGVTGWVRNEPDGSVAGHFEGPAADVEALVAWCHQGPSRAHVDRVEVRLESPIGESGFHVR